MKKTLFAFLMFFSLSFCEAQNTEKPGKIVFRIECSQEFNGEKDKLNLFFSIQNLTGEEISIPRNYIAVPFRQGYPSAYLWYEIGFFDEKDTINMTDSVRASVWSKDAFVEKYDLKPYDSFYYKVSLSRFLFSKKGAYKVRLLLARDMFNFEEDLSSNWYDLNFK